MKTGPHESLESDAFTSLRARTGANPDKIRLRFMEGSLRCAHVLESLVFEMQKVFFLDSRENVLELLKIN